MYKNLAVCIVTNNSLPRFILPGEDRTRFQTFSLYIPDLVADHSPVDRRKLGVQNVPLPEGVRPLLEQQRPGVRVVGPLLRGAASPESERRPKEGQVHARLRLGHLPAVLGAAGRNVGVGCASG